MTSKDKGNVALGRCIKFATSHNMTVCIPLNDAQDYDLVIDSGHHLLKIQVKYTSSRNSNKYTVDTRVRGHKNMKGEYYIKDNVSPPDYYFITTSAGQDYLIPYKAVKGKNTFTLNDSLRDYMVV